MPSWVRMESGKSKIWGHRPALIKDIAPNYIHFLRPLVSFRVSFFIGSCSIRPCLCHVGFVVAREWVWGFPTSEAISPRESSMQAEALFIPTSAFTWRELAITSAISPLIKASRKVASPHAVAGMSSVVREVSSPHALSEVPSVVPVHSSSGTWTLNVSADLTRADGLSEVHSRKRS